MDINHRLRVITRELEKMGNMEDTIHEIEDIVAELSGIQDNLSHSIIKIDRTM